MMGTTYGTMQWRLGMEKAKGTQTVMYAQASRYVIVNSPGLWDQGRIGIRFGDVQLSTFGNSTG